MHRSPPSSPRAWEICPVRVWMEWVLFWTYDRAVVTGREATWYISGEKPGEFWSSWIQKLLKLSEQSLDDSGIKLDPDFLNCGMMDCRICLISSGVIYYELMNSFFLEGVTFHSYPLVNVYTANWKITIFLWENTLFLWPFSIAMLNYQRVTQKIWITTMAAFLRFRNVGNAAVKWCSKINSPRRWFSTDSALASAASYRCFHVWKTPNLFAKCTLFQRWL